MAKYKVSVLESADEDLAEIVRYYDTLRENLGEEFYDEYLEIENRISENPHAYQKYLEEFRRANLKRFPYSTFYQVEDQKENVTVNAVVHQSRNPKTIKKKLRGSKKS